MKKEAVIDQIRLLEKSYEDRSHQLDDINKVSPWHRIHRIKTNKLINELLPKSKIKILDAGGGTGISTLNLIKKGHDVVFVDILPEMIEIAKKRFKYDNIEIIQGNLEDLLFLEESSFDLVICTQVLNFCRNIENVFNGFYKLLKPNGRLLADIDNPYRWSLIEALSGHLDNALEIARNLNDKDRNIVGAGYFFRHRDQILHSLKDWIYC